MVGTTVSMLYLLGIFCCGWVCIMLNKYHTSPFCAENRDFMGLTVSIEESAKAGKF